MGIVSYVHQKQRQLIKYEYSNEDTTDINSINTAKGQEVVHDGDGKKMIHWMMRMVTHPRNRQRKTNSIVGLPKDWYGRQVAVVSDLCCCRTDGVKAKVAYGTANPTQLARN